MPANERTNLNALIGLCNAQYQALAEVMGRLTEKITTDEPLVIQESLREINRMQTEASMLDAELVSRLKNSLLDAAAEGLMEQRRHHLRHLAELNGLLIEKLEGKMSVMSHELEVNRQSRRAMTGYRSPDNRRGGMLHKST